MNSKLVKIFPQRKSIRLKNYDYALSGHYYITICTQNRQELFGKIVGVNQCVNPNLYMELNNVGEMVKQWYLKTTRWFTNTILDEYQIMPNHLHGIIVIQNDGRTHGSTRTHHWEKSFNGLKQ